jgi:hypothetical protein
MVRDATERQYEAFALEHRHAGDLLLALGNGLTLRRNGLTL